MHSQPRKKLPVEEAHITLDGLVGISGELDVLDDLTHRLVLLARPVNQVELGPTDTLDQRPEVSIRTVRKKRGHIDLGRHVPAFGLDPSRHRRRALDRAGCGPASTLLLLALLPVNLACLV